MLSWSELQYVAFLCANDWALMQDVNDPYVPEAIRYVFHRFPSM